MKAVAIIALLVLFAVVECRTRRHHQKKEAAPAPVAPETSSWVSSGFKFPNYSFPKVNFTLPHLPTPTFNLSRFHHIKKPNVSFWRFAEETPVKPSLAKRIKDRVQGLWPNRLVKKTTPAPAPVAPETSSWVSSGFKFPNYSLPKVNFTRPHIPTPTFNLSRFNLFKKPNVTFWRFEEETPVAPVKPKFHHRLINGAKNLWAKRPWKKTAPAPAPVAPETSSWNSAGFKFDVPRPNVTKSWFNFSMPKFNFTMPKLNFTRPSWLRFAEESNVFDSIKNAVKGLWAKRPWGKKAENKTAVEESAQTWTSTTYTPTWNSAGVTYQQPQQSWNSAGVTYPQPQQSWNSAGVRYPQQNTTQGWNSQGYRFEETAETAQPQTVTEKIKSHAQRLHNHVKGLWANRPWAKKSTQ